MNRIYQTILAAALLLAAAPGAAHADPLAPPNSFTFETVDSVQMITHVGHLAVKGIGQGQSTPIEYEFRFYDQASASDCQKLAVVAMERAGRYYLNFTYNPDSYGFACKLMRR